MRILFTGASSFTGLWFVRELQAAGHEVVATFRRGADAYESALRRRRVELVRRCCRPIEGAAFGDERFLDLLRKERWDVLAHHGAEVTDYKSPDFDVGEALQRNTTNLRTVLRALADSGGQRVVLTGSVFETGEGAGSDGLRAVSPYGLSKMLTWECFSFHCQVLGLHLGKFVVPNPFGPYEEPRYTSYLATQWLNDATARCASPEYVRDNIHVTLLARAYASFVGSLPNSAGRSRINPSGYAESQRAFTNRFADALRDRLGRSCAVEFQRQSSFDEPRVRINTDGLDARALGWDEDATWDGLARYYAGRDE